MENLAAQVNVVRNKAGIFPFPRGILSVTGSGGAQFLHNLLTHDIKGLQPGQERPACLLDRQGKIRFFFLVCAREKEILLETEPGAASAALEALNRYLVCEDVTITEVTEQWEVLALHGPRAQALAKEQGDPSTYRWDFLGVPGYHLRTPPQEAKGLRKKLEESGAQEIGPDAVECLRIEAGTPWVGREIDESVIFNELGMEEWVSFTKGCYLGQETVARIKYRAHPPRRLTGFFIEGNAAPPAPSELRFEGKPAGKITSLCFSPTLSKVIALGFLHHGAPEAGLTLSTPQGARGASAAALPFIARS